MISEQDSGEGSQSLTYDGKKQDRDKILYLFDEGDGKAVIVRYDQSCQETTYLLS